jgi:hypothetical protein
VDGHGVLLLSRHSKCMGDATRVRLRAESA